MAVLVSKPAPDFKVTAVVADENIRDVEIPVRGVSQDRRLKL